MNNENAITREQVQRDMNAAASEFMAQINMLSERCANLNIQKAAAENAAAQAQARVAELEKEIAAFPKPGE